MVIDQNVFMKNDYVVKSVLYGFINKVLKNIYQPDSVFRHYNLYITNRIHRIVNKVRLKEL